MLYQYKCKKGHKVTLQRSVKERNESVLCLQCAIEDRNHRSEDMERDYNTPFTAMTFEPFLDININPRKPRWITSKRQFAEECAANGCQAKICRESFNSKRNG
jgi:hypothetical protein